MVEPTKQENFYLNLGFKEIDLSSDCYSEMGLNTETLCFLQNECKKKDYCDEEGKQYRNNNEFKNLGYFILNGPIKESFFSYPLSIRKKTERIFFSPVVVPSQMTLVSKDILQFVIKKVASFRTYSFTDADQKDSVL